MAEPSLSTVAGELEQAAGQIAVAVSGIVKDRALLLECVKRISNMAHKPDAWVRDRVVELIDETLGKLAGPR